MVGAVRRRADAAVTLGMAAFTAWFATAMCERPTPAVDASHLYLQDAWRSQHDELGPRARLRLPRSVSTGLDGFGHRCQWLEPLAHPPRSSRRPGPITVIGQPRSVPPPAVAHAPSWPGAAARRSRYPGVRRRRMIHLESMTLTVVLWLAGAALAALLAFPTSARLQAERERFVKETGAYLDPAFFGAFDVRTRRNFRMRALSVLILVTGTLIVLRLTAINPSLIAAPLLGVRPGTRVVGQVARRGPGVPGAGSPHGRGSASASGAGRLCVSPHPVPHLGKHVDRSHLDLRRDRGPA